MVYDRDSVVNSRKIPILDISTTDICMEELSIIYQVNLEDLQSTDAPAWEIISVRKNGSKYE